MSLFGDLTKRHPRAVDAALAFAVTLLGLPSMVGPHPAQVGVSPWQLRLFQVALATPLIWRRRAPMAVLAVIAAVVAVQWTLPGGWLQGDIALPIALYGVAARASRRHRAIASAVVASVGVLVAARWKPDDWPAAVLLLWSVAAGAVVLGVAVRLRRDHLAMLLDRADRLAIERDQEARLAAAAERSRIAREMHDIIAHNLSVMIGLADGARYAIPKSPEHAEEAMEKVSVTGRQALGELRRLLGLLRDDDVAELGPLPGLGDLGELIDRVRAVGLPVVLRTDGTPGDLPAGVQLAVYRIVQEALTNTIKHAGPHATAAVRLRYDPDGVTVDVADTGRGDGPVAGQGRGISGMAERAAVYGGVVESGRDADGGWRVHARLGIRRVELTLR
ncbi:histidine kinase [Actinoallomurus sp. NPDC050550]|uniref:sensor histidine kinase n=1 Tax=Actinoallomurus sp. NPDC050550 TaxID=3154937 RepID=UPI0033DB62B1